MPRSLLLSLPGRAAAAALSLALPLASWGGGPVAASLEAVTAPPDAEARIDTAEAWVWPVSRGVRIVVAFSAPAHAYGAGHRGLDIAADSEDEVRAPASGVVAFAGTVVDRPVLTIDHGGGLVSTLEPVRTTLNPGDRVARGEVVGHVATGGHSAPGSVHLGARLDGEYVNPLLMLGGVPRAVLLACC
ncbi:M23 family metallopeptidase [Microbacterium sp. NPDC096154]|uniref:murein hydrolase activator EnvC family protein n=1 Tax=Microbacterium sp. NPDC096154 TaxID=3155549 RepID=UPI003333F560